MLLENLLIVVQQRAASLGKIGKCGGGGGGRSSHT